MAEAGRRRSDLLDRIAVLEQAIVVASLNGEALDTIIQDACDRARGAGLSIARLFVTWRLLNPLFFSQSVLWRNGLPVTSERFRYGDGPFTGEWQRSYIPYIVDNELTVYRSRLSNSEAPREFPIFDDLAANGMTDFLSFLVGFGPVTDTKAVGAGVLITVCSDREGGFREDEVEALHRLKYILAVAIRSDFQSQIAETLARTYLGDTAGKSVLSGRITRGDGEAVEAAIWYCDLRNSTALCEHLGVDRYIPFLNDYFTAAAKPVADAGGEILDFIGDAILAIFPLERGGIQAALDGTDGALAALERFRHGHRSILGETHGLADVTGIALDMGTVVYGNIGTEERLTFSVIGPTVNRVARIERLTKVLHEPVLATGAIAAAAPGSWRSRGAFTLDGVDEPQEIFALSDRVFTPAASPAATGTSA